MVPTKEGLAGLEQKLRVDPFGTGCDSLLGNLERDMWSRV